MKFTPGKVSASIVRKRLAGVVNTVSCHACRPHADAQQILKVFGYR
jgi:hypothetical protein